MEVDYWQVDAFSTRVFAGNPAGVCVLDRWLDDSTMQAIAAENNLSETAFLVGAGTRYRLRWFTPASEVDLCGHATLASAFVLQRLGWSGDDPLCFETVSGALRVRRRDELLELDFPARPGRSLPVTPEVCTALGAEPTALYGARDLMAVFTEPADVERLRPDMDRIASLDCLGMIVTAPGTDTDFVSRFFAPSVGVPEDPVTGSAHCTLVPYWARRLGRQNLHGRQLSRRGGELFCRLRGDRVMIGGRCALYLRGTIVI